MNDPRGIDISEGILAGVLTGVLGGISSAMLWFKESKRRIYERIGLVEKDLREMEERHVEHHAQLVELRANQVNTAERLAELKQLQKEALSDLKATTAAMGVDINNRLAALMAELRTKT